METQTADSGSRRIGEGTGLCKVPTSRFGEIEVTEDKIISMASPFLGFPESSRFILRLHGEKSPFMWLQSLDNPHLAFVVIQPEMIKPDYQPSMPGSVRDELQFKDGDQLEIMVILTIPHGRPREMTANLLGPVVVNVTRRLAKQVLLDHRRYEVCWPVFLPPDQAGDEQVKGN